MPLSNGVVARAANDSQRKLLEPIRSPADFRRVLREGRRIRKAGLTIVIAASSNTHPRLGLVVSRRLGTAVVRNRIKRRLRAAAAAAGWSTGDHVVIPTASVATMPFPELVAQLRVETR